MEDQKINVAWFRRDLRLKDNAALFHALQNKLPVLPLFIFDTDILDKLDNKSDARVQFIHNAISWLEQQLNELGSSLAIYIGRPAEVFSSLFKSYNINAVFSNLDYEPYAVQRDKAVASVVEKNESAFLQFKDQVIFDTGEVMKDDGRPYTVFTPYSRKWKAKLNEFFIKPYPTEKYFDRFLQRKQGIVPTLAELGFDASPVHFPGTDPGQSILKHYAARRDFPGLNGTSKLGVHFRFGTISIREAVKKAMELSTAYLDELIWRDFYQMILWHHPHVGKGQSFKPAYDNIQWRNNEDDFERWCAGQTGYPIVDAGMRELNQTGFMHNRVRMIVASFLCKHLLLDWRWGEAYFAEKLLDYDLAANNGGWQWAAGSGCDAAPYFRIFNPWLQTKKFDPDFVYIKKWVPEFKEVSYPKPMVDHDFARNRCLAVYTKALKKD